MSSSLRRYGRTGCPPNTTTLAALERADRQFLRHRLWVEAITHQNAEALFQWELAALPD
jgi:hypothetical protein